MGRITSLLDNIDVKKQDTDELYDIFRQVPDYDYPVLRFYLYPGTVLIRQRINLPGAEFSKISDLGCPPAFCIHSYERANVPYQAMFYACSFPGGEDIPSTIKESIRECRLFIMMVSPNYRKSEVCLNEMGAAWMCDGVKKIILLLPSVDFDRMGWLISLQKATKLTDARGLDQIHDQIVASLSTKVQTSTWNRYKAYFLKQLEEIPADAPDSVDTLGETTELSQLDVLGLSEKYALHSKAYVELLTEFTSAMNTYTGQLNSATQRIKNYNHNPQLFTATNCKLYSKQRLITPTPSLRCMRSKPAYYVIILTNPLSTHW